MPPAQLLMVPSTLVPVASAEVFRRASPAAGPVSVIGVFAVIRRFSLPAGSTAHLPSRLTISTIVPPWAAISTATSSGVMSAKSFLSCRPIPGNINYSLVYSWLTQSTARSDARRRKPMKSLL